MDRWAGAVQASKPSPVKGAWALRGVSPPAASAGSAVGRPGVVEMTVRARARTLRTVSGASP